MKDRVVEHPNRYRLVPVPGEQDVVDLVPMPGIVTEPGTPYAVHAILSDQTAALYGLGPDALVDEVLKKISCIYKQVSVNGKNEELGDTDGYVKFSSVDRNDFEAVVTDTKIIIPKGIKRVLAEVEYGFTSSDYGKNIQIRKNGIVIATAQGAYNGRYSSRTYCNTQVTDVSEGDYFELFGGKSYSFSISSLQFRITCVGS